MPTLGHQVPTSTTMLSARAFPYGATTIASWRISLGCSMCFPTWHTSMCPVCASMLTGQVACVVLPPSSLNFLSNPSAATLWLARRAQCHRESMATRIRDINSSRRKAWWVWRDFGGDIAGQCAELVARVNMERRNIAWTPGLVPANISSVEMVAVWVVIYRPQLCSWSGPP